MDTFRPESFVDQSGDGPITVPSAQGDSLFRNSLDIPRTSSSTDPTDVSRSASPHESHKSFEQVVQTFPHTFRPGTGGFSSAIPIRGHFDTPQQWDPNYDNVSSQAISCA